jgi:two-component system sensor histidine kinase RegB
VGCYTLLMRIRLPIPEFIPQSNQSISDLHVFGMWLGFVMIAGLMAHFVASMGKTLRDRDKQLAEAREQALRDERVVALATLAAGAAHELGTPLGTMSVLAEEMADENPVDQHPELHENIDVLRSQIQRCKDALSVMSASAGATRADSVRSICVDNFVSDTVAQVRRLRPDCRIKIRPGSARPAPAVVVEQTLTQAFLNVLHNAVDASPLDVVVEYNWTDADVNLVILDSGEGVVLESDDPVQWLGRSTKEGGLGLGLFLSYTAIRQAGGHISINRRPTGGTSVTINIPLPEAGTLSS